MSITQSNPNTVFLGGERTQLGTLAASEAITPGMLVERFNSAGVIRIRKHATAGGNTSRLVATEMTMLNKGIDDACAANDLIEVSALQPGAAAWMFIGSDTIVAGDKLESAGNGLLRKLASGTAIFTALENKTVTAQSRIRVEVL